MSDPVIKFQATVAQVKTMADGGLRLVLDLPETAVDVAGEMMQVKRLGAILEIAAVPIKENNVRRQKRENTGSSSTTY